MPFSDLQNPRTELSQHHKPPSMQEREVVSTMFVWALFGCAWGVETKEAE
jgi:hypothetical protein